MPFRPLQKHRSLSVSVCSRNEGHSRLCNATLLRAVVCVSLIIGNLLVATAAAQRDDEIHNWIYYRKYGEQSYDANSSKKLEQIANARDAEAAFEIGYRCLSGGFDKGKICPHGKSDFATAILWLHKAADLGYADGAGESFVALEYTSPATANDAEALFWLKRSVQHGSPSGMQQLARFKSTHQTDPDDATDAIGLYRHAAQQGEIGAMISLGEVYLGGHDVTKDITQVDTWFSKADVSLNAKADGNAAPNEFIMGKDYLSSGETSRAIEYLLRAARQPPYYNEATGFLYSKGQQDALQLLGEIYRDGKDVAANPQYAQICFNMRQSLIDQGNAHDAALSTEDRANADRNRATNAAKISGALSDLTNSIHSLNTPSPTQSAANAQLANIAAVQAHAQQAQSAKPQQIASEQSSFHFSPTEHNPLPVANSGTVPPPTCVDLGPGNCMPIAQYQQLQAQRQVAAQMQICPASGFIPGVGHYVASDVWVGMPCTPGQPIPAGASGSGNGGASPGLPGGGNALASGPGSYGGPATNCIIQSTNKEGAATLQNICSFSVHAYWTPLKPQPGDFKVGNNYIDPGTTYQTQVTALYRLYACPANYFVLGPDEQVITHLVDGFRCVKK